MRTGVFVKAWQTSVFRLFQRYRDLAPQVVPLDYTCQPDVKLPYQLISSMPELKVPQSASAHHRVPLNI